MRTLPISFPTGCKRTLLLLLHPGFACGRQQSGRHSSSGERSGSSGCTNGSLSAASQQQKSCDVAVVVTGLMLATVGNQPLADVLLSCSAVATSSDQCKSSIEASQCVHNVASEFICL
jgi:hypothetical protein